MPNSLYFVAVIPPSPVFEQVQEKRLYFKNEFGSSHALKSPPHITLLAPFNTSDENEDAIISLFEEISSNQNPFEVVLKDYSAFPPKVIYVDVLQNEPLNDLQERLEREVRKRNEIFKYNYKKRKFTPHMTLALRDLSEENFKKAWTEFKDAGFNANFSATSFSLLKHNQKKWNVLRTFEFPK